jgi:hypothetical protein
MWDGQCSAQKNAAKIATRVDNKRETAVLTLDGLTWAASIFCAIGAIVFVIREKESLRRSRLFLPIYAAGILQWVLFGFYERNWGLVVPSALQLLVLAAAFPAWVQTQRRRS